MVLEGQGAEFNRNQQHRLVRQGPSQLGGAGQAGYAAGAAQAPDGQAAGVAG